MAARIKKGDTVVLLAGKDKGKRGQVTEVLTKLEKVVVEGIGDHGCEYMTGGVAVILGETGRNFGAGMSGGVAYVYDPKKLFKKKCNTSTFEIENLKNEEDLKELKQLIKNHKKYTDSAVATKILNNWNSSIESFIKVMPTDYKRVLLEMKEKELKVS